MNPPNRIGTTVAGASGAMRIVSHGILQPDAPTVFRSILGPIGGPAIPGMRLIGIRNGVWMDLGAAPSLRDDGWHPGLPDRLAAVVGMCRDSIGRIEHCERVSLTVETDSQRSPPRLRGCATFHVAQPHGGILLDEDLDRIPMVRAIERAGSAFADWFGVQIHDDLSGHTGEIEIDVSESSLRISRTEMDDGIDIVLRSRLEDGSWTHTAYATLPHQDDAVTILRALSSPWERIGSELRENPEYSGILGASPVVDGIDETGGFYEISFEPGTLTVERHSPVENARSPW